MCRFGTFCPRVTIYELTADQAVLSASRYSDSGGVQVVPVRANLAIYSFINSGPIGQACILNLSMKRLPPSVRAQRLPKKINNPRTIKTIHHRSIIK